MNYLGEKVYIGRRIVKEKDGIVYQGDILCIPIDNNSVMDLLEFGYYNYLTHENDHLAQYGEIYVSCLTEHPLNENIWFRSTLLKRAAELNNKWTSINIPNHQKTKKI